VITVRWSGRITARCCSTAASEGQECRHLADVQRLPPSPGDHAAGRRQAERADRLPDPSLDLRTGRRTDRRAAFSAESLPEPEQGQAGKLERPALQGAALGQCSIWRHEGRRDLDFTGYKLDHVEMHECNYNWKTFIEVYLEDYHVVPYHPGLGNFVTCDDLTWQFGDWYSVQKVGITSLKKSGSKPPTTAGRRSSAILRRPRARRRRRARSG
jgi:hypothetical protein